MLNHMQSIIIRTFHGETFYWERICISTCNYSRSNKRVVFSVTCQSQNKRKDRTTVGYTQVPHHIHLFLFHLFMFNCQDSCFYLQVYLKQSLIWWLLLEVCSARPVKTVSSVCFHLWLWHRLFVWTFYITIGGINVSQARLSKGQKHT